jgi:hypothetical protein
MWLERSNMAQQSPSFNMNRLSSADRILMVTGALFFIDTFLHWQAACADVSILGKVCVSVNAWGGNAAFLGVLAAIFAIALVVWLAVSAMGTTLNVGVPASTLNQILVGGTLLFGILKFLFSAFDHGAYGAWIGLILLLAMGYGAYMKMQEPKPVAAPPAPPPIAGPPAT